MFQPKMKERMDSMALANAAKKVKSMPMSMDSDADDLEAMAEACKCPECGHEGPESTFKQEAVDPIADDEHEDY